jgi:hypothetical protein
MCKPSPKHDRLMVGILDSSAYGLPMAVCTFTASGGS